MFCDAYPRTQSGASVPHAFGPCASIDEPAGGCCPVGLTELRYWKKNHRSHPPMLLIQTSDDKIGDREAGAKYFAAMKAQKGTACHLGSEEGEIHHGLVESQMSAFVAFVLLHIKGKKGPHGSSPSGSWWTWKTITLVYVVGALVHLLFYRQHP